MVTIKVRDQESLDQLTTATSIEVDKLGNLVVYKEGKVVGLYNVDNWLNAVVAADGHVVTNVR
jgi:hypothetical protein